MENVTIIATETWFTSQIHDAEYFDLDHFAIYRRDRGTDTAGGGVLIDVNITSHHIIKAVHVEEVLTSTREGRQERRYNSPDD